MTSSKNAEKWSSRSHRADETIQKLRRWWPHLTESDFNTINAILDERIDEVESVEGVEGE
jgi:DNA integrity scanning protein DisA with diadenylate cyclase activity